MSKYIDAEKLIAEIEDRLHCNGAFDEVGDYGWHYDQGMIDAYNHIKEFVTSLQQEQPELPGYNKALLEVKSKVDELYEEASIGLNEYDSGLYNGIAETCMKLRGFIKARLDSDEVVKS